MTLASPHYMVWELFQGLRRLCARMIEQPEGESETRQDSAIAVILAVQCVEVFLNIYFRVVVNEPEFSHAAERICHDLEDTRFGLDRKLKEWPNLVFGKNLDLGVGAGQRLVLLKNTRHKLMHFSSSQETFSRPEIVIHGMANTSVYASLSRESAIEALHVAEDFLCEVFALQGIPAQSLPHALHRWTGRPPV